MLHDTFHGVNHFGLIVEDMNSIVKEFNKQGVRYSVGEVVDERVRIYCFDKNGFEFELIEYYTDDIKARFKFYEHEDAKAGIEEVLKACE